MYCTSLYSYFKNLCCAIKILLFHIWLFLILYNSQSVICTHDFPFQDSESPPENLFKGSILDSITDTMPNWKSTFLRLKQRFLRYRFVCVCVCVCVSVRLFVTPWTVASPGSSVYGISQARKLEWVAIFFSRGSYQPRDWTGISCIGRWILYHWATW